MSEKSLLFVRWQNLSLMLVLTTEQGAASSSATQGNMVSHALFNWPSNTCGSYGDPMAWCEILQPLKSCLSQASRTAVWSSRNQQSVCLLIIESLWIRRAVNRHWHPLTTVHHQVILYFLQHYQFLLSLFISERLFWTLSVLTSASLDHRWLHGKYETVPQFL